MDLNILSKRVVIAAFTVLFIGCNNDDEISQMRLTEENSNDIFAKQGETKPFNAANPYDVAGELHNQILELYFEQEYLPENIEDVDEEIHALILEKTGVSDSLYLDLSVIEDILAVPYSSFLEIVDNPALSSYGQSGFIDFVDSLLLVKSAPYEDLYDFITQYESDVLLDTLLSTNEKRIFLTTTSIIRYSIYFEKRRKDKDWESSVGNIAAAMSGAYEDSISAVTLALVAGLSKDIVTVP